MTATITLGPFDIPLLKDQVDIIMEMIENDQDSIVWGIVEMLNDIIDTHNQE